MCVEADKLTCAETDCCYWSPVLRERHQLLVVANVVQDNSAASHADCHHVNSRRLRRNNTLLNTFRGDPELSSVSRVYTGRERGKSYGMLF